MAYIQKILFGSPGTGKSHRIKNYYSKELNLNSNSPNYIPTVFHPEYTYGDFMGKLVPITDDTGKVEYKYYAGHFIKALGQAYKNLITSGIKYDKDKKEVLEKFKKEIQVTRQEDFNEEQKKELEKRYSDIKRVTEKVLLVIDEINRGNSSSIFGTVFQLLDRNSLGWSEYPIIISDLEAKTLLREIGFTKIFLGKDKGYQHYYKEDFNSDEAAIKEAEFNKYIEHITSDLSEDEKFKLSINYIKLPPNLSIIGTMNTSDNSIYFMDSAFKRRWDWEFIDINPPTPNYFKDIDGQLRTINRELWKKMVDAINDFIKSHSDKIRRIEDKQIGYYFIKGDTIQHEAIRNKLMFFLWDSVFSNEKKPLLELLNSSPLRANNPIAKNELVTFGDFVRFYREFNTAIIKKISN